MILWTSTVNLRQSPTFCASLSRVEFTVRQSQAVVARRTDPQPLTSRLALVTTRTEEPNEFSWRGEPTIEVMTTIGLVIIAGGSFSKDYLLT